MKRHFLLPVFVCLLTIPMMAYKSISENSSDPAVDPNNGKTYKTVQIGDQIWMAENLDLKKGPGSMCAEDNTANCDKYGGLYKWEAAKRAVPKGWHLPSKEEWETLVKNLGGTDSLAYSQIIEGGSSGFSASLGGMQMDGIFFNLGRAGYFWSSSEYDPNGAWICIVGDNKVSITQSLKMNANSVRCIKD